MSGRSRLLDHVSKEIPRLTEKERDALIAVHPYIDGMTHREAADYFCISVHALQCRLQRVYHKLPWIQNEMRRIRELEAQRRKSLRRPIRIGDWDDLGSDGVVDTLNNERIVRKF